MTTQRDVAVGGLVYIPKEKVEAALQRVERLVRGMTTYQLQPNVTDLFREVRRELGITE